MEERSTSSWRFAAIALMAVATIPLAGAWLTSSPRSAWLARAGQADWIVYPVPADSNANPTVELPGSFRAVVLFPDPVPPGLHLALRAMRRAEARIDGAPLELPSLADWKDTLDVPLGGQLAPGPHTIEITVWNGWGPPALWCELRSGSQVLAASGAAWVTSLAGTPWRPAALASEGRTVARRDDGGASMSGLRAVSERWPGVLVLAACALAAGFLLVPWREAGPSRRPLLPAWALPASLTIAWGALFLNNLGDALPLSSGFDAPAHLAYARHVLENGRVPLADEGWQMFQPPLYYALLAAGWKLAGSGGADAAALLVQRVVGWAIGAANLLLVWRYLRASRAGTAQAGPGGTAALMVAAFLPPMLALHQFPTNEILVAALASASFVATLRLLRAPEPSPRGHALLGAILGAALLAKFSALLLALPVGLALVSRALRAPPRGRLPYAKAIGALVVSAVVVAGWHFGRVWWILGDPFVGGWEARPGLGWWGAPGYRTIDHFARFGAVFGAPLFSGLRSLWDGLYSTTWGDGLLSGQAASFVPPWWDPWRHALGLLLALAPAALAVAGCLLGLARWTRAPDPEGTLMLSALLAMAGAFVLMTLRVPSVAQDKAAYGLLVLVPIAWCIATGVDALWAIRRWAGALALASVLAWAANAYCTFWIDRAAPGPLARAAAVSSARGEIEEAILLARRAHDAAPADWGARVVLARLLTQAGARDAELEAVLDARGGEEVPASAWLARALQHGARGRYPEAATAAQRALALAPDDPVAARFLAETLEASGAPPPDAEQAWRALLRVSPHDEAGHVALARILAASGRGGEAELHARLAASIAEYWRRRDEAERGARR